MPFPTSEMNTGLQRGSDAHMRHMLTGVASTAVTLLSLHLLVDQPEGMLERQSAMYDRLAWNSHSRDDPGSSPSWSSLVSEALRAVRRLCVHGQKDVDEQVTAASCDECRGSRWEENSNLSVAVKVNHARHGACSPQSTHDDEENVRSTNSHGVSAMSRRGVVRGGTGRCEGGVQVTVVMRTGPGRVVVLMKAGVG